MPRQHVQLQQHAGDAENGKTHGETVGCADEHVAAEKQRERRRADEPGDEMQRLHFEQ